MDYPLWVVDLENYEPGDESTELAKTLLDLKDVKLRGTVNKEGVPYFPPNKPIFWT